MGFSGMFGSVDKDKKPPKPSGSVAESPSGRISQRSAEMQEIYRKIEPELRRNRPNPQAIAAALEAAQRLAAEADAEEGADDVAEDLAVEKCPVCGHHNRDASKFCGMCGASMSGDEPEALSPMEFLPQRTLAVSPNSPTENGQAHGGAERGTGRETHHYHHHYHHHYFPGGVDAGIPRGSADSVRGDLVREEKVRPTAALRGDMSRAEAAVRRVTQEWMLACNTKHLDDLLDLYTADAMVLRSNYPPVRGAAAVREFFFAALDAGLGEVELEPLRLEVAGDLAYEAGRCKALVPSATGKRREERGKYLWVCSRQSNGEWKLVADSWSSDLSFTTLDSDIPQGAGVKTSQPRKNP
jgi:ketosteroid isomerase-like protein